MGLISSFLRTHKHWKFALPLILIFFLLNIWIRSGGSYDSFHMFHTIFNYLIYLVLWMALFMSFTKAKKVIFANLAFLLALFVIAELLFFFILGMPFRPTGNFSTRKLTGKPMLSQLGYLPNPNQVTHELKMNGADTVFEVDYTVDSLYRRVVPTQHDTSDQYALFFGCSVTYGYGVEDNENMPFFFHQYLPHYKPYNYAFNGYKLGEDGHVIRKGNFADDRFWTSKLYEWALESNIIQYVGLSLPQKLKPKDLEVAVSIIEQSRDLYQEQMGNACFYVLIYPEEFEGFDPEVQRQFLQMLKDRGIQLLEGYDQVMQLDEAHRLVGDPHPNPMAHEKMAKKLASDIQILAKSDCR